MFTQIVDPAGQLWLSCLVALVPVVLLLVLLAVFRDSAWLAVLIGSIVTFLLAAGVWQMPVGDGARAYLYGAATGIWSVDWITFWGAVLFNTLAVTGVFENFRRWSSLRAVPMCACRRCSSPGPSALCSRGSSASATLGRWCHRS